MNEKTVQVVSCAVAVAVMILLLSGDMIISQFLPIVPNQEMKEADVEKDYLDSPYPFDVSFMEEVNLTRAVELIQSGDEIFLFSAKASDSNSRYFLSFLLDAGDDITQTIYFLNRANVRPSTEGYDEFVSYSEEIRKRFLTVPYLMAFRDGKYQGGIIGRQANLEEVIFQFLHQFEQ